MAMLPGKRGLSDHSRLDSLFFVVYFLPTNEVFYPRFSVKISGLFLHCEIIVKEARLYESYGDR